MTSDASDNPHSSLGAATVAGIVIAGGRSVRFGGEKTAASLGGRPLLIWAADRLLRHCRHVAANVRAGTAAEQIAAAGQLPLLYDEAGDAFGPLAGIKVGLQWASKGGATLLAVSPCDAPLLPDDLYPRLLSEGGGGAAMAETADGPQPLCSLWPVTVLPAVTAALTQGAHPSLWRLLDGLGASRVHFAARSDFANVNTRADLESIAAHFPAAHHIDHQR